jgi:hypothetical protein
MMAGGCFIIKKKDARTFTACLWRWLFDQGHV